MITTIPIRKYAYTCGQKIFVQKIEIITYELNKDDNGCGIFRLCDVNACLRSPWKGKDPLGGDRQFVICIRELLREAGVPERYTQEITFAGEYQKATMVCMDGGSELGNYLHCV